MKNNEKNSPVSFPEVTRAIENFLSDEEGNITRNKILSVGALAIVLGVIYASAFDSYARHRSHSSHSSHRSHSSSRGSYHGSHSNTHSSHGSHSNSSTWSSSSNGITDSTRSAAKYIAPAVTKTSSTLLPLVGVTTADAVAKAGQKLYANSNLGQVTDGYIQETAVNGSTLVVSTNAIRQIYAMTNADWSCIYQQAYYVQCNPDVLQATGGDANAIFSHFVEHGMSEGRIASPEFNVQSYMLYYPDLVKAYGSDLKQYYLHYMNAGKAEGRIAY